MEALLLMCMAVAYMITDTNRKHTAAAAYKAGKEPPGLVKARMRHENGGGARKSNGKPAGHGAARRMVAERWGNACEKAKDRANDKHRRWRAWYAEQAPERDEKWREKKQRRIERAEARTERWQSRWSATKDAVNPHARTERQAERQAWEENARREHDGDGPTPSGGEAEPTSEQDLAAGRADARQLREQEQQQSHAQDEDEGYAPDAEQHPADKDAADSESDPAPSATDTPASTSPGSVGATENTQGGTVYQHAVQRLIRAADQVAEYRTDLASFADDLAGKGWGSEVTGPVSDMDSRLTELEGTYRDLAAQIKHQGDQGAEAYDQAPWVPGPDAVMA